MVDRPSGRRVTPGRGPVRLSSLDFPDVCGKDGINVYPSAPATRSGILGSAERFGRQWSALVRPRPVVSNPSLLIGEGQVRTAEKFNMAAVTLGPEGERLNFEPALCENRAIEVRAWISPFRADRKDVAAIVRTVAGLRAQGISAIFVEMPVSLRFLSLHDGGASEHRLVGDVINATGEELDVPIIQTTGVFFDDDFVGHIHLNAVAAANFSAEVSGGLQDLGI